MKKLGAYSERRHGGNVMVLEPRRRPRVPAKHPARSNGEVYLSASPVELYSFDESYMEPLRRGDPATHAHFASYFGQLLRIKLRSRKLPAHVIHDVQQETFYRVLEAVRTGDVRQPERLGAYVNSVCNNILLEHYRLLAREQHVELEAADGPDVTADLEVRMLADERRRNVRATINRLPERDRVVLWAILLERDKDEVCRELKISREYLRVLTHRAIESFRHLYRNREKEGPPGIGRVAQGING